VGIIPAVVFSVTRDPGIRSKSLGNRNLQVNVELHPSDAGFNASS
jgi:hypothetical protein